MTGTVALAEMEELAAALHVPDRQRLIERMVNWQLAELTGRTIWPGRKSFSRPVWKARSAPAAKMDAGGRSPKCVQSEETLCRDGAVRRCQCCGQV